MKIESIWLLLSLQNAFPTQRHFRTEHLFNLLSHFCFTGLQIRTKCQVGQGIGVKIRSLNLVCELGSISNWRIQYSQVKWESKRLIAPGHCQLLFMDRLIHWVCTWRAECCRLAEPPHVLCKSGKWEVSLVAYIWYQILTKSANTSLGLSFEDFSDFFPSIFLFFLLYLNLNLKLACCYDSKVLVREVLLKCFAFSKARCF